MKARRWDGATDVCRTLSIVSAAGRLDDPHTVRLARKIEGRA